MIWMAIIVPILLVGVPRLRKAKNIAQGHLVNGSVVIGIQLSDSTLLVLNHYGTNSQPVCFGIPVFCKLVLC